MTRVRRGVGLTLLAGLLGLGIGALLPPAAAQSGPAIIMVNDSVTGGLVPWVGDVTNSAIRVNLVASAGAIAVTQSTSPWVVSGTVAATQSGTWTVQPGNTANTTAWLVTGTGGTFPVTGTFWQATQPVSIATMPSTPVTGTFWQATQPVSGTVAFSNSTIAVTNTGTFATQAAATLGSETTKVIGTVRAQGNLGAAFDAATGAAPPANGVLFVGLGSGATGGFLTAVAVCDTPYNVNISTATTTLLVTGVSGRHVRICAIDLVTAAANNVALISGTGSTCGTGTAAIVGTTAATGWNFGANGGLTKGNGLGMVLRTVATGDSVCAITSAATQLSGSLSYTIY